MGYVDKILIQNEVVHFRAKKAWLALTFTALLMTLFLIIYKLTSTVGFVLLLFFFLFLIFKAIIAFVSAELAVTNKRIIGKKGVILRNTMEMRLKQIESISVSQPLIGRIFGYGTIKIVGTGGTKEEFKAIMNPYELQRQYNNLISKIS